MRQSLRLLKRKPFADSIALPPRERNMARLRGAQLLPRGQDPMSRAGPRNKIQNAATFLHSHEGKWMI